MALTRAQLLAGNQSLGVVLPGQVQAVSQGLGVFIDTDGTISIDASTAEGLVRLNNSGAYNGYIWPNTIGQPDQFLQLVDASGTLRWADASGFAVVVVSPTQPSSPDEGELWYNCNTGSLLVYQNCVSPAGWTNVAQTGLEVTPANTSASPPFTNQGTPNAGTIANPYDCTVTTTTPGTSIFIVNEVTVTGLAPYQYVPIVDMNAVANGGRFHFSNNYADASGTLIFETIFIDLPQSTSGTGYTAAIRVGYASAYIDAIVNVVGPLSMTTPGTIAGTPAVGATLTYTRGTATGGVPPLVYTWAWKNNLGNVLRTGTGAGPDTYLVPAAQAGNTIFVELTVTDSATPQAVVTGNSPAVGPITTISIASPGTITGTTAVGGTLTYNTGTATGGVAPYNYTWVWKNNSGNLLQTGGATYNVASSQSGKTIYVELTATDSGSPVNTATGNTPSTATITTLAISNVGSITGNATVGGQLTYSGGVATNGVPPYNYTWVWKDSGGATLQTGGNTYNVTSSEVGKTIFVALTVTDSGLPTGQTVTANTSPTAVVTTLAISNPGTITGTAATGATLTYTRGSATGGVPPLNYTWIWKNDLGATLASGSGAGPQTYVIPASQVGRQIYVELTAQDSATTPNSVSLNTASTATISGTPITNVQFPTTIPGTASFTWNDGNGATLTASSCIEFSVNGNTFTTSATVNNTDTITTRWINSPSCGQAAQGTTISGTLTSGGLVSSSTLQINRLPTSVTLNPTTRTANLGVVITPVNFSTTGANTAPRIWGILSAGSTPEYSIDGGTNWIALPSSPAIADTIPPGVTALVRYTTGSSAGTETLEIRAGYSNTGGQYQSATLTTTVSLAPFPSGVWNPQPSTGLDSIPGLVSGLYTGTSNTITPGGCIEVSTDNSTWVSSPNTLTITPGGVDTLYARWVDVPSSGNCGDSASDTLISGTLSDGTYELVDSITVQRQPASFGFNTITGAALNSLEVSDSVTITGINTTAYVTYGSGTTAGITGTLEGEIGGSGTWTPIPASGTTFSINNGQSLKVRFNSGTGVGATNTAVINIGDGDNVKYTQSSPNFVVTNTANPAFPTAVWNPLPSTGLNTVPGLVSGTYNGTSTTITPGGCIEVSGDGTNWVQSPNTLTVIPGTTNLRARWISSSSCGLAPDGTAITGTVGDGTYTNTYNLTIDRLPDSFGFNTLTGQALNTVVTSASVTITNINCPAYINYNATNTTAGIVGTLEANVASTGWQSVPASGNGLPISNNQSLQIRFNTGTTAGAQQIASIEIGDGDNSVYTLSSPNFDVTNTADASIPGLTFSPAAGPTASPANTNLSTPGLYGTVTATWPTLPTNPTAITSTGNLEFRNVTAGGSFGQGSQTFATSDTIEIRWIAADALAAVDGNTLTGTLTGSGYTTTINLVVDKVPDAYDWGNVTSAGLTTVVTSSQVDIDGINAPVRLTYTPDPTLPLTSVQALIDNGTWTNIPQPPSTGLLINPADTAGTAANPILIRGTTGGANDTTYSITTQIGDGTNFTSQQWDVKTTAVPNVIQTPNITAPTGTTNNPNAFSPAGLTVTGSSYTIVSGSPGAQTDSDWQVVANTGSTTRNPETSGIVSTATAPANGSFWEAASSNGSLNGYTVEFGGSGNLWVRGGELSNQSTFQTSPDLVNWTTRANPTGGNWGTGIYVNNVTFSNGLFIATGSGQVSLATSTDGITWTGRTASISGVLSGGGTNSIAYGAGGWIVVGGNISGGTSDATIIRSTDGVTWTPQTPGNVASDAFTSISFNGSIFVLISSGGVVFTSSDGLNWTPQGTISSFVNTSLGFGNGLFVAGGLSGAIYTSPNGTTWTPRTSNLTGQVRNVTYANSVFVACDSAGKISTSPDGITWTAQNSGFGGSLIYDLSFGNNVFAAISTTQTRQSPQLTTITLTDNTELSSMQVGDSVVEVGGGADATGTIAAINVAGPTLTVAPQSANWTTGATVKDTSRTITVPNAPLESTNQISGTSAISPTAWTNLYPSVSSGTFTAVAQGGGLYVAVGYAGASGIIYTSPDGVTWTNRTVGSFGGLYDVIYTGTNFVAVGENGLIRTSPDGITWTTQVSGTTDTFNGVAYDGVGRLIAVGGPSGPVGTARTSTDGGVTWSASTLGSSGIFFSINYLNGNWIATVSGGDVYYSSNGTTWNSASLFSSEIWYGSSYGAGLYVLVSQFGNIKTSSNLTTWTTRTSGVSSQILGITFANSKFTAVPAGTGNVLSSTDGITWSVVSTNLPSIRNARDVIYAGGKYVAVGNNGFIATSADANSWNIQSGGFFPVNLNSTIFANNLFVAVGGDGTIATSPDGNTWTSRNSGVTSQLKSVTFSNGTFVAVGNSGSLTTSPDGLTWTAGSSGTGTGFTGVTYGNGKFVAVGSSGMIRTSTNGTAWSAQTSGTATGLLTVTYGNGLFVVGGGGGVILTSPDGVTWTSRTSGTTNDLSGSGVGNGLLFVVGQNGTILTSPDGITWTSRVSGSSSYLYGFTYSAGIFVTTSSTGEVYTSPNGITWTSRTSNTTNPLYGVAQGNGVFVAVGGNGTIITAVAPAGGTALSILGANTDGFAVGNLISNGVTGGSAASGTIYAINGTTVTVAPSSANWASGQNLYRGQTIVNVLGDTSNFTSYFIAKALLATSTTYYARVRYHSATTDSNWSNWASFGTAATWPIPPGSAMGGGYFGGQINDGGIIYNLIVSPKPGVPPSDAWKTATTVSTPASTWENEVYGFPASQAGAAAGAGTYPAFAAARALSTSGYNDWYIPAKNELEVLYYFLKPGTGNNSTSSGSNPNAVSPEPVSTSYTNLVPGQTSSLIFRTGGGQDFDTSQPQISATQQAGSANFYWRQSFTNGLQDAGLKTDSRPWRAIRREYANAPVAIGAAYGGGYFAGQYQDGGVTYNLIVAPKATGQTTTTGYKTSSTGDTNPNSQNAIYGKLATDQFNDINHPAFQWAKGLTIATFNDWYVPAKDEMLLIWYNLYSGWTTASAFKVSGTEVFDTVPNGYWTSTEDSSNVNRAFTQPFDGTSMAAIGKTNLTNVRAVRRVPA